MRTAGVIGGVGAETTARFYLKVVQGFTRAHLPSLPPVLIFSMPFAHQIEDDVLLRGQGVERSIPFLLEAARILERGGADFIALPCNTLHVFIEQIARAVNIPVLNVVKETTRFLARHGVTRIGVLASRITTQLDIYGPDFAKDGITAILPDESDKVKLGQVIHGILNGRRIDRNRQELQQIIARLYKNQVDAVLLACTDLQLLKPKCPGKKLFDTMKILASATVREILTTGEAVSDQPE